MKIAEELYRALDDAKKRKLEAEQEALEVEAQQKGDGESDEMSQEDLMELIRQIMVMKNLSRQERDLQIKELMERSKKGDSDFSGLIEVEKLRADADAKSARGADEKMPDLQMAKPFSYDKKEEQAGGLYAGRQDERYSKPDNSEWNQIKNEGNSEFENIRKESERGSEYARIVEKGKEKGPSKDYWR